MIAFGTAKKKSAFKLYARSQEMDFELANEISGQIEKYEKAYLHAEDDEREDLNLYDYVDEKYHSYIDASQKYWGIIMDKKKAPCSYLLYSGDIRREIGLIKCKSESTNKECITTVTDGAIAEKYKFLKNDLLKVDVVLLTNLIYKRIGIKPHTVNELMKLVDGDQKVWDIYHKGLTMGINQCEKESTTNKVMKYKPTNVSELAAFIAAIRPAFKSMYSKLENREKFEYGIPAFDKLLQTPQFPQSFILYQEQTMNTLNYAGFPMGECYGIIKAIAKKHPEKVRPLKSRFIEGFKSKIIEEENVPQDEAQQMSEQVWQIINDSCGYGFNCVSGSTKIMRSSINGKFEPTVEEMYNIMNSYSYAKRTGHLPLYKKYRRLGYGYALSMFDDNRLHQNKIVDIKPAGVRQTYEIVTATGKSIVCTDNHKFPTPNGKKRLDELSIGDLLYCKGEYEMTNTDYTFTQGNYIANVPMLGEMGFQRNPAGESVKYHKTREYYVKNNCPCAICKCEYSVDKNFELHHINHNRTNNDFDNLQWLCNSCHKKIHYKDGRVKKYDKGIPTYLDPIVSITPVREEMTYDICMSDPAHTFVSENGLVVSNSSHAYCMSLDSLYNAWQKAHHPYEFYEVLLQKYSDKGNKDKVALLKAEMLRGFGIKEGAYKYGADNRKFQADQESGVIYPSLLSIKGLSQALANDLYSVYKKLGDNVTFYDLWKVLKGKKSCNTAKLDTLIEIDYFQDFASIGKLKKFLSIAEDWYGRSQFRKDNLSPEFLDIIIKYTEETDSLYRKFDYESALKELWEILPDVETPLPIKLQYELEHFGFNKTISDVDSNIYFCQEYECKFKNPKLLLYNVSSGSTMTVKVNRKPYDENPIAEGDLIRIVEMKKDAKWYKDGEEWCRSTTNFDDLLKKWNIIRY